MKKLIVVVDGEEILFIANEPNAYFDENKVLIVSDQKDNKRLGGFANWDYWYLPQEPED